jgi:hypothetical protein
MASNTTLCANSVNTNSLEVKSGMGFKRPVVALTDLTVNGALRSGLTIAESGTIFLLPLLTTGTTQTIALPAPSADTVGVTYTFIMIGNSTSATALTGAFNVETDATATKIIASTINGDGDNSAIYALKNSYGFAAAAVPGSAFTITGLSSTVAVAWTVGDLIDSLAANTGSLAMA